jgi:hypothetical protein
MLWGVNPRFHGLSPCIRQVAYALRTRAPLATRPKPVLPLDLHVLSLPLAFILSQDQTLRCNYKSLIISFAQVNPLQKSTKLVHLAFFYAFVKILKNSFFTKNQHRFQCWPPVMLPELHSLRLSTRSIPQLFPLFGAAKVIIVFILPKLYALFFVAFFLTPKIMAVRPPKNRAKIPRSTPPTLITSHPFNEHSPKLRLQK